ncbi:MAG: hypothetical protein OHK0040_04650 [bacterium]
MMLSVFFVFGLVFTFMEVINFLLAPYFIKLEMVPVILVFLCLYFDNYKGYLAILLLGILFGAINNKIPYYVFSLFSVMWLLKRGKEHFLFDTPLFLFVFSFLFYMAKTVLFWIYVKRYSSLTSALVVEYLFNALLNALLAYPLFVVINGLYKLFLRLYEKSLHYA